MNFSVHNAIIITTYGSCERYTDEQTIDKPLRLQSNANDCSKLFVTEANRLGALCRRWIYCFLYLCLGDKMTDHGTMITSLLAAIILASEVAAVRYVPKWKKQVNFPKNKFEKKGNDLNVCFSSHRLLLLAGMRNSRLAKWTITLHLWWQWWPEVFARCVCKLKSK